MNKAKELLITIAQALVEHPEDVRVTDGTDEMGVLLTLDVHPSDMGKVIGKQGNTAKALRTLLRVVGMTESARISLKISEPEDSERQSDRELLS